MIEPLNPEVEEMAAQAGADYAIHRAKGLLSSIDRDREKLAFEFGFISGASWIIGLLKEKP